MGGGSEAAAAARCGSIKRWYARWYSLKHHRPARVSCHAIILSGDHAEQTSYFSHHLLGKHCRHRHRRWYLPSPTAHRSCLARARHPFMLASTSLLHTVRIGTVMDSKK